MLHSYSWDSLSTLTLAPFSPICRSFSLLRRFRFDPRFPGIAFSCYRDYFLSFSPSLLIPVSLSSARRPVDGSVRVGLFLLRQWVAFRLWSYGEETWMATACSYFSGTLPCDCLWFVSFLLWVLAFIVLGFCFANVWSLSLSGNGWVVVVCLFEIWFSYGVCSLEIVCSFTLSLPNDDVDFYYYYFFFSFCVSSSI